MKKELLTHFYFWVSFFVLITLFKHYFSFGYWPFYIGGLIGIIMPDLDHLIYIYFIKPQDLTSQRVNYLLNKSEVMRSIELIYETRSERRELIFHSILFQGIFFVLAFLMLSSSGSLLGRGLVLSFMLHLSVDQLIDLKETGGLSNWFKNINFRLDFNQSKIYWMVTGSLVFLMGFLF